MHIHVYIEEAHLQYLNEASLKVIRIQDIWLMRSTHKDTDLFGGKITIQGSGKLREENPGYQARNLTV